MDLMLDRGRPLGFCFGKTVHPKQQSHLWLKLQGITLENDMVNLIQEWEEWRRKVNAWINVSK